MNLVWRLILCAITGSQGCGMKCQDYLRDYFLDLSAKAAFASWGLWNCGIPKKRHAECLPLANTT